MYPATPLERRQANRSIWAKMNLSIELLRCISAKESQGLVIWVDPKHGTWQDISDALVKIEDTYVYPLENGENSQKKAYGPLILDRNWWLNDYEEIKDKDSKYHATSKEVLEELETPKLKFKPTMEILWQSNPSLVPQTTWDGEVYGDEHEIEKLQTSRDEDMAGFVEVDEGGE